MVFGFFRRLFSSSSKANLKWTGYSVNKLPKPWATAVKTYAKNGATKKVGGPIDTIEILHRKNGQSPVHKSSFNKNDPADIVSMRVTPVNGRPKTHHVYIDGRGTAHMGDKREYSTSARRS
ncbi:hypothetical protein QBC37DRAFT_354774 [Rhypophila decipiens]|uniref:Uncharacterized protein n=1 Tax=Rhypophila decipiens TaxID=261697 RepID=A0AAN6Y064_9PEZI|nr:hypothetical protein QBC37DRAFT_354774 [Rhypophila decipiens]